MNILIRLPNWLGDMVMSTAFVQSVNEQFPTATIDLIAKKGIDSILNNFPPHNTRYLFDKQEYKGLKGVWQFGKMIRKQKKYDAYFCLPESFSSAFMGYATGAIHRIGYKNEGRSFLLTHAFTKKHGQYHVEEYMGLLEKYTGRTIATSNVLLATPAELPKRDAVIINMNSEAQSRRWPKEKAIRIVSAIRSNISQEIILVGSPKEKEFVDSIFDALPDQSNISNLAGKSPLPILIPLMKSCRMVVSSESGPAQISNAVGTPTLITFGASNELLSKPLKASNIIGIRYGKLPCEPCLKNTCSKFPQPECLLRIDETSIVEKIKNMLQSNTV